jgi:hypothetical protein
MLPRAACICHIVLQIVNCVQSRLHQVDVDDGAVLVTRALNTIAPQMFLAPQARAPFRRNSDRAMPPKCALNRHSSFGIGRDGRSFYSRCHSAWWAVQQMFRAFDCRFNQSERSGFPIVRKGLAFGRDRNYRIRVYRYSNAKNSVRSFPDSGVRNN